MFPVTSNAFPHGRWMASSPIIPGGYCALSAANRIRTKNKLPRILFPEIRFATSSVHLPERLLSACGGIMKLSAIRLVLLASVALIAASASAQAVEPSQSLKLNQTFGYGAQQLLTFTYFQNFDCIEQP